MYLIFILVLTVFSQCKYRYLSNIKIDTPAPPFIKFITNSQIAYQYDATIITFNLSNKIKLQNISISQGSNYDILQSQNIILYIKNDTLYQTHSNSNQYEQKIQIQTSNWVTKISSSNKFLAFPIYQSNKEKMSVKLYGPAPQNTKTLTWDGFEYQNINGGSEISILDKGQYYFAAGGIESKGQCSIYLQKGNSDFILNVYKTSFINCRFEESNKKWQLKSYEFNTTNYHLLSYVSQPLFPNQITSRLISQSNDKYNQIIHFHINGMIGISLPQQNVILTADNTLCRVLEHNLLSSKRQHKKQTMFPNKPLQLKVSPSQKYITSIVLNETSLIYFGVLSQIDQEADMINRWFITGQYPNTNILGIQILADQYIFQFENSPNSNLIYWNLNDTSQAIITNLTNVLDFCISNKDYLFALTKKQNQVLLGAYKIDKNIFKTLSITTINQSFNEMNCIQNNYIFLISNISKIQMNIWQYNQQKGFIFISSKLRDLKKHANFAYSGDLLIFTNKQQNYSTFYDYGFREIESLSFNLLPKSFYEIVRTKDNQIILAVGMNPQNYTSLEYYSVENTTINYKGTFPYLDDGIIDLSKTVLFPRRGIIHAEYYQSENLWSTDFSLSPPPQWSYGYFIDEGSNSCNLYRDAIFKTSNSLIQLTVLNKHNKDVAVLENYRLTSNTLIKTQSHPLKGFKNSASISMNASSSKNEVIITGHDINGRQSFEIRNLNLLESVIYKSSQASSLQSYCLESVDTFNGMIASLSLFPQKGGQNNLNLRFSANTENIVAINNKIFSKITLFSTCPDCDRIVFTGMPKDASAKFAIVVQDFVNPSIIDTITADCQPEIFALSPQGTLVAWSCLNKSQLYIQNISAKNPILIKTKSYLKITELSFLNKTSLLAILDNTLNYLNLEIFNQLNLPLTIDFGLTSKFTIDYKRNIYAFVANSSLIQIADFSNKVIDSLIINNIQPVASISFHPNKDIYIANALGNIIILSQLVCPNNQIIVNGVCVCKQLFKLVSDQCFCDFILKQNGDCACKDGQYFNGDGCQICSFFCTTCDQDGMLNCKNYQDWFIISLIVVIVIILTAILLFKIRKCRQKKSQNVESTMYTTETKTGGYQILPFQRQSIKQTQLKEENN